MRWNLLENTSVEICMWAENIPHGEFLVKRSENTWNMLCGCLQARSCSKVFPQSRGRIHTAEINHLLKF